MKPHPHFILCGVAAGILGGALLFSSTRADADPNSAETPAATAPAEPAPATPAAPTNMTMRFELFVKDTHTSVDFYTRILGFQCDADTGSYIQARSGSVRIGICDQATLPEGHHFSPDALQGRKGVGTEIVLEVENLDAYYERVTKSGYAIREELAETALGAARDFRIDWIRMACYLRITEKKE